MHALTCVLVCAHMREYVCHVCYVCVYVYGSCVLHVRMCVLVHAECSLRVAHTAFSVCTMCTLLFLLPFSCVCYALLCVCPCVYVVYMRVAGVGRSRLMRSDMCVSCVTHTTCYVSLAALCYSPSCCACDCVQSAVRVVLCMCANRHAMRLTPITVYRSSKRWPQGCILSSVQLKHSSNAF